MDGNRCENHGNECAGKGDSGKGRIPHSRYIQGKRPGATTQEKCYPPLGDKEFRPIFFYNAAIAANNIRRAARRPILGVGIWKTHRSVSG